MRNEKQNSGDKFDRAATKLAEILITLMTIAVSAFVLTVVAWSATQLFTN